MIKVGILGAETMAAGELIRILINHPDVELTAIASAPEAGRKVASLHRGLIGDTDMSVIPELSPEGIDAVFLCGEQWMALQWMQAHNGCAADAGLRIIDLTGAFRDGAFGMVYGLPEHNRKALVRGATRTSIPSAAAMPVELALFPLAKNSLLNAHVAATVSMAATFGLNIPQSVPFASNGGATDPSCADVAASTRLDPIAPREYRTDSEAAASEISAAIQAVQPSFTQGVSLKLSRDPALMRGATALVEVPCGVALPELQRLYDEAYSDHSFTYTVTTLPCIADVANTNKCLLHLCYDTLPDTGLPTLHITSVTDHLLKGSAGTAVHCLNLLFGLSERTGLSLKASAC